MRDRRSSAANPSFRTARQVRATVLVTLLIGIFPSIAGASTHPPPDGGFGGDGTVILDSYSVDRSTVVAVQPDGRVVLGAAFGSQPGLLRLNEDGSVDKSFGTDGWVAIPSAPFDSGLADLVDLAIQADGFIITGWSTSVGEAGAYAFVRVDSSGLLDDTFGEDGLVLIEEVTPGWSLNQLGGLAVQADGKIVGVGSQGRLIGDETFPIGIEDALTIRLHPDGSLDPSFGTGGVVVFDVSDTDGFADVAVAPSGEIIAGGYSGVGWNRELESEPTDLTIVRLASDGRLDPSFGSNGVATFDVLDQDGVTRLAIQGRDRIVAFGNAGEEFGPQRAVVARWAWNGSLDDTFGTAGSVIYGFGGVEVPFEQITDGAIQGDHKVIVAGYRYDESDVGGRSVVASRTAFLNRLNQDGSPDMSFGEGGRLTLLEGGPEVFSIALDPADRLLAAGRFTDALWVMRFLIDVAFDGGRFIDDDLNQFEGDIAWIAAAGITLGCNPPANTHFCPERSVTRGEMAAFLVRALGLTDRGDGDLFLDDDTSVFEADIDRLATAGITLGCNPPANTHFCPDRSVTRGEMAAFLVRALGLTDAGEGDLFADDDTSVFEADIDRLATAGITLGCNPPANTHFCPRRSVTRGEMAALLHRAMR